MKLSVVVPFYKAEEFVPLAMENVARQASPDVEFVLVDDCSGDGTLDALERHAARVPGARIVTRDTNGGLAAARNSGIDAARGRYLTFLDADDWYGPGYLADLTAAIEHHGCDFIRTDHIQVKGRRRWVIRSAEGRRDEVFAPRESILPSDRSAGIDYPYAWAGAFDLERMGKDLVRFDDGLHTCEDRPWLWRIYVRAASHAVVGLTGLYYLRGVTGSLTQTGDARQLHFLDAFDTILADLQAHPELDPRFLHKAVRSYCAIMAHHIRLDDRFTPALRDELHRRSARALHRLPGDVLEDVFTAMADKRVRLLRRLMRKHPEATAA